jgi:flagellar hook protein FlgE
MFPALNTALSALDSDSTAVDVIGNNLANLNTTGFKASTVSFQDLVDSAIAQTNTQPGFGVSPASITQIYSQGAITTTSGQYDNAISGNGFFVVNDGNNGQLFTRNGNFTVNSSGDLLTNTGQNVEGWNAVNGVVNANGAVGNITLPNNLLSAPVPTANLSVQVNLDASQTVGTPGASFSTSLQVYDSLGNPQMLTLSFTKTAANTYTYAVTIPGQNLTAGVSGTPSSIATGTMTFDSSGNLLTPAPPPPASNAAIPLPITGLADGAANLSINWNIYDPTTFAPTITQFAESSSGSTALNPTQDGSASANIGSISMGQNGQILAQYGDSPAVVVAQLALAQIRNPESLVAEGNSLLQATGATSQASIGLPGTAGRGTIQGGALESSTVDIAGQFTNLIVFQNSYEAVAKVVTTVNTMEGDTIDLIPAQ